MKKRYVISLIVVALLLVVSGISYAYFSAVFNNGGTTSTVRTGTMSIEFIDGSTVSLENAIPGSSVTKTFKVKNTGDIATTYNISLTDIENTFADKTDLVYTLTLDSNIISSTQIPSTSGYIITNQSIGVGVTQEYALVIAFKESTDSQDDNQNISFKGTISITSDKAIAYKDSTGASSPELSQGMIPVVYDASGNVRVADINTEWYNYSLHNWANAVLVNCADTTIKDKYFNSDMSIKSSLIGTTISMDEILQMYVWIPRYKYILWNAENGFSDPQAINIVFEDKTTAKSAGTTNGTYLTHPAFTFGDTELNGIWVGKFENSGSTSSLTIKPNASSLTEITIGDMFNATRNQELIYANNYGIDSTSIDTHMMKNMEWGAVAYLSSSIYGRYNNTSSCISAGCQVWRNNIGSDSTTGAITGCSQMEYTSNSEAIINGTSNNIKDTGKMYFLAHPMQFINRGTCYEYLDWSTLGVNASTTGNQYGIYDMSGGADEYVMGNMATSTGTLNSGSTGLTQLDSRYYDSYAYGTEINDLSRGKLGDATREIINKFDTKYACFYDWNGLYVMLPHDNEYKNYGYWLKRGGDYLDADNDYYTAGIFTFFATSGADQQGISFRSVLTAE